MTLPRDANHNPVPLSPNKTALARTYDATISAATDVSLNASTTFIEVTAIDAGIFMRYASTVTSSNFDEFIAAGQTRQYIKPSGVTVVSFLQESATAKLVLIEK